MLNNSTSVQGCDATGADSSNDAGLIKIKFRKPTPIKQSFSGLSSPTGGQGALFQNF